MVTDIWTLLGEETSSDHKGTSRPNSEAAVQKCDYYILLLVSKFSLRFYVLLIRCSWTRAQRGVSSWKEVTRAGWDHTEWELRDWGVFVERHLHFYDGLLLLKSWRTPLHWRGWSQSHHCLQTADVSGSSLSGDSKWLTHRTPQLFLFSWVASVDR